VGDLCLSPDGSTILALCSTIGTPPRIVRLDARTADQVPVELTNSIAEGGIEAPGIVERLVARASDGTAVGSWLVRPAGLGHVAGATRRLGPRRAARLLSSWHWRWNPHLLVARGYAVLMPDPAISTGYGQAMIQRGWGDWGAAPYTDVAAAVDGALAARRDLDPGRTALMGGSFGGYMANWVAGQTDRYRAIVTHASLWELRGFHGTTDTGAFWEFEMGDPYTEPERYISQSPFAHLGAIRTPMLYPRRAGLPGPVSEALRLWTDSPPGVEGKLLYFPDGNHWILKPQNARLWYATVLAFLDEHSSTSRSSAPRSSRCRPAGRRSERPARSRATRIGPERSSAAPRSVVGAFAAPLYPAASPVPRRVSTRPGWAASQASISGSRATA